MGVERFTVYKVVCDLCGYSSCEPYFDSPAEAVLELDDDFWTARDDDVISCEWCVDFDIQVACGKRPEGHRWDTPTNKFIAQTWTQSDDGEYRIRYCGDCSMMQRQVRGGKWFGYDRRGNWLGNG